MYATVRYWDTKALVFTDNAQESAFPPCDERRGFLLSLVPSESFWLDRVAPSFLFFFFMKFYFIWGVSSILMKGCRVRLLLHKWSWRKRILEQIIPEEMNHVVSGQIFPEPVALLVLGELVSHKIAFPEHMLSDWLRFGSNGPTSNSPGSNEPWTNNSGSNYYKNK